MRALIASVLLVACGGTGQERVPFPVHGAGTGEISFMSGEWSVTLSRAQIGFGPIYFCATAFADVHLCAQSEAEWLGSATIDALDSAPQMVGDAAAVTATVRSAMFDYGRSFFLTAEAPHANSGAPAGRSALFSAQATREGQVLVVHAEVDIDPNMPGRNAVIGASVGTHEITGGEALVVRFDPAAWWRSVDFDRVAALDADGDGEVFLAPGDVDYEAIRISMTAGQLPVFEW